MKPVRPPTAWGSVVVKLESEPDEAAKQSPATMRMSRTLRVVKTSWKSAAFLMPS
jgi:hypothetical protein